MPGYIPAALHKFRHAKPKYPIFGSHPYTAPVYTKQLQLTPAEDTTPYLDDLGKKRIQQVIGTLLFYARAVDPTLLMAINAIAAKQASPMEKWH
eukprot:15332104-Ditylum_brightwellii.AAC.1